MNQLPAPGNPDAEITHAGFEAFLRKIGHEFGKPAFYDGERKLIFWKRFKGRSFRHIDLMAERIIATSRSTPLLPEFEDADEYARLAIYAEAKKRLAHGAALAAQSMATGKPQVQPNDKPRCWRCHDSGRVDATRRNDLFYPTWFWCPCEIGLGMRIERGDANAIWSRELSIFWYLCCGPHCCVPRLEADIVPISPLDSLCPDHGDLARPSAPGSGEGRRS